MKENEYEKEFIFELDKHELHKAINEFLKALRSVPWTHIIDIPEKCWK